MDRTQACGACNRGSTPLEVTKIGNGDIINLSRTAQNRKRTLRKTPARYALSIADAGGLARLSKNFERASPKIWAGTILNFGGRKFYEYEPKRICKYNDHCSRCCIYWYGRIFCVETTITEFSYKSTGRIYKIVTFV